MRLMDYKLFCQEERLQYISSQKMTTGIPYFGGKSKIGKYIYNTIFNMAVTMNDNGDKPLIFVDAFTGGGKMALSMPDGWFKLIVMNDLDYGVYCYYKCCQENYRLLLDTVDKLVDGMSEQLFHKCLQIREDKQLDPYMCAGMTYVCAACSFNNILEPSKASYKPAMGDNNEKQELDKVKARAHRTITKVAKQLNRRDYIIENLSYEQLIAKYNGLDWQSIEWTIEYQKRASVMQQREEDDDGDDEAAKQRRKEEYAALYEDALAELEEEEEETETEEEEETETKEQETYENTAKIYTVDNFAEEEPALYEKYRNPAIGDGNKISRNILWYLDPPYHPYCLYGLESAPYANSFSYDEVVYMTKILSGEVDKYGELHYFIKSDYDPKKAVDNAVKAYVEVYTEDRSELSQKENALFNQCVKILKHKEQMRHDFDSIEDEGKGFQKICVGGFDKGALTKEDEKLVKTVGYEYIWTKGLPAGYKDIPKVVDKD